MIDYYETKEHPVKNRRPDFGSVRRGGETITHGAVRGLG